MSDSEDEFQYDESALQSDGDDSDEDDQSPDKEELEADLEDLKPKSATPSSAAGASSSAAASSAATDVGSSSTAAAAASTPPGQDASPAEHHGDALAASCAAVFRGESMPDIKSMVLADGKIVIADSSTANLWYEEDGTGRVFTVGSAASASVRWGLSDKNNLSRAEQKKLGARAATVTGQQKKLREQIAKKADDDGHRARDIRKICKNVEASKVHAAVLHELLGAAKAHADSIDKLVHARKKRKKKAENDRAAARKKAKKPKKAPKAAAASSHAPRGAASALRNIANGSRPQLAVPRKVIVKQENKPAPVPRSRSKNDVIDLS